MFVLLVRGCAVDIGETKLDDDAVVESVGHLLRLSDTVCYPSVMCMRRVGKLFAIHFH